LPARAISFVVINLAMALAFQTLALQLSGLTGGEDGLTFKMPEWLSPSVELRAERLLGVMLGGRLLCYKMLLVVSVYYFPAGVVGSLRAGRERS
jgi:branched-chain amino acid transport system permease protein